MKIILCTGGSNFERQKARNWNPPSNLKVWNYWGESNGTGSAFVNVPSNYVNLTWVMVAKVAEQHPEEEFRLITVAWGGTDPAQWLQSATAPHDMYTILRNNVNAALTALGATEIDYFFFQNTNGTLGQFGNNFNTMLSEMRSESWFPADTPCFLGGLPDTDSAGGNDWETYNNTYRDVAAGDQYVKFYDLGCLVYSLWDTDFNPRVHLNAYGIQAGGAYMAYFVLADMASDVKPTVPYTEIDSWYLFDDPPYDLSNGVVGTSRKLFPISVPPGHVAKLRVNIWRVSGQSEATICRTGEVDAQIQWTQGKCPNVRSEVANSGNVSELDIYVDENGYVSARARHVDTIINIQVLGYKKKL